jgi:hypothetical protein
MKVPSALCAALLVALGGCEQESQTLPFSPESEGSTVRTLSPSAAGAVTSPAGAAVRFPAGALTEATEISITPVAPPAAIAASGSPVSRGFRVTPQALTLAQPASVELRIDRGVESSRVWLASLVVVTPDGAQEIGGTRLDLRAGLAEASIRQLGTLAMVIPDPSAVFMTTSTDVQASLASVPSALLPAGTDSVVVGCGDAGARCDGLSVVASESLSEKVSQAAAVYPHVSGSFAFDSFRASGEVTLRSSIRLLLGSGAIAENVEVRASLRPTNATVVTEDASAITLTNVQVQVTGGTGAEAGSTSAIRTVVIRKSGNEGFVTVSRTFELRDESGQLELVSVDVTFPVQIHQ